MKSIFLNQSIRFKLISMVMSVTVLALLGVSWIEYKRTINQYKEQMIIQAKLNNNLFAELSIAALAFEDKSGAVDQLATLKNLPQVIYAFLYDSNGDLFAKYQNKDAKIEELKHIHSKKHKHIHSHNNEHILKEKEMWILHTPISFNGGDGIGFLHIAYSASSLNDIKNRFIIDTIQLIILITIFAYIITYKFQSIISTPIANLSRKMKTIAKTGEHSAPMEKVYDDELGNLYDGFNNMMNQLQKRKNSQEESQNDLKVLNNELENRVLQRTKELEKSLDTIKETQSQLIQSEKMAALGGLVAGVAHEINTPIGLSITGITHIKDQTISLKRLYDKQDMSQQEFENYLKMNLDINDSIYLNLKRAAELIQSFKEVAVTQSNESKHIFNLRENIDHILISLRNRLKKTDIDVKIECDKTLKIYSDPGSISQIFTNFITNSLIHGFKKGDKGVINIKVIEKDKNIHIIYKDSGKGIKEDNLAQIFNPFFTTNRQEGGTGLGLNIVYNIVTSKLNGAISVKSTFGQGVEFEIILQKYRS